MDVCANRLALVAPSELRFAAAPANTRPLALTDLVRIARSCRVHVLCEKQYFVSMAVKRVKQHNRFRARDLAVKAYEDIVGDLKRYFTSVVIAPETHTMPRSIIAAAGVGEI